jgi:hypothetical protein
LITVWVFAKAEEEITDTGYRAEINGMLLTLATDGHVPSAWFHRETADNWKTKYPKGRADSEEKK